MFVTDPVEVAHDAIAFDMGAVELSHHNGERPPLGQFIRSS